MSSIETDQRKLRLKNILNFFDRVVLRIPKAVWVILGIIVVYHLLFPTQTWNYKTTVIVETPEGDKTGFAVRQVAFQKGSGLTPEMLPNIELKGEAVVVDLGKRGVLFVLLGRDHAANLALKYFLKQKRKDKIILTADNFSKYVSAVTFRNLLKPQTIQRVNLETLEKAFGEGVFLREISMEITGESVTWGIEKWLPWLPERKKTRGYIGGTPEKRYEDPSGTYLTGVEFSRGRFW